jgi:hypothetical protein
VSGGLLSAADDELATVGGKVIYNGQPLTDATITFHLKDDQFVGGKIKDGRFLVDRVPSGTAKVTIDSKNVALPAKFASPESSGLSVDVGKGKVVVNFMLSGRKAFRGLWASAALTMHVAATNEGRSPCDVHSNRFLGRKTRRA